METIKFQLCDWSNSLVSIETVLFPWKSVPRINVVWFSFGAFTKTTLEGTTDLSDLSPGSSRKSRDQLFVERFAPFVDPRRPVVRVDITLRSSLALPYARYAFGLVLPLEQLRLEVDGALMELVHQEVVDGVDVIEGTGLERLEDHVLVEAGQLEHVVYDGLVKM